MPVKLLKTLVFLLLIVSAPLLAHSGAAITPEVFQGLRNAAIFSFLIPLSMLGLVVSWIVGKLDQVDENGNRLKLFEGFDMDTAKERLMNRYSVVAMIIIIVLLDNFGITSEMLEGYVGVFSKALGVAGAFWMTFEKSGGDT